MGTRLATAVAALGVALAACGDTRSVRDGGADAGATRDGAVVRDGGTDAAIDAAIAPDGGGADAGSRDAGADGGEDAGAPAADAGTDAGPPDAGDGTLDVRVLADSACADLSFDPPSIAVPAGTTFTVRWINATGCTEIDVDKDGTVPIVLGLAPGESYHDTIREWCGSFTGTFYFRAYYAPSFPYYLDVDCSR